MRAYPQAEANAKRVEELLTKMTLAEKVALIRGANEPADLYQGQAGYLSGIPRLHIPPMRFADGPPGLLTRVPAAAETATMGVAATFSVKDALANGREIANEAKATGIQVVLQPFINIDRDIEFGRGFNTFGEDPFLSGAIGAAEIRGIQREDIMAMAKHYIGYDSNLYNTVIDPQTLHEVYLPPFAAAVEANVSSVMCSYNMLNGDWACGNEETQNKILKGELGFKGFVTSDWGAIHSVLEINHGLDMEMQGNTRPERGVLRPRPNFFVLDPNEFPVTPVKATAAEQAASKKAAADAMAGGGTATIPEEPVVGDGQVPVKWVGDGTFLYSALRDGTVTEATVTAAARRVLGEMERFGYLDGTEKLTITPQPVKTSAAIIEKTAEDAAVLLQNERQALPLRQGDLESLALIGPTAGQVDAIGMFGERSGGLVEQQVGPLQALRQLAPGAKITYAVDDDMTGVPIPAANLSHDGAPGLLRSEKGKTVVDAQVSFAKSTKNALPPNTDAEWSGDLSVPEDGTYWIYLEVLGGRGVLKLDGHVQRTGAVLGGIHGDTQKATQDNAIPTTDGLDNVRRAYALTAGKHKLSVALTPDTSGDPAQVRLSWMTPKARQADHEAAIAAARAAHTAVVFAWSRRNPVFGLPGDQNKLIEEVAAVNPNTIVVLNVSQPVAMPWLNKVKAVLQMWWPGDEGGWATAKVLLGKTNPAGRLPMTWASKLTDYAATDPAYPERAQTSASGHATYSEGVLVGYRWFDAKKIEPLFPFGHGLSYTSFEYSDMKAKVLADGSVDVTLRLRNSGKVAGDEVPQLYLDAPAVGIDGVQFAPKTLVGFDRVTLLSGQSKVVSLRIASRAFEYWSTKDDAWKHAVGERLLHAGASSKDLRLSVSIP